MSDYSKFPFGDFTVEEVFNLARESKDIGDDEFVMACMEAIRLNKCIGIVQQSTSTYKEENYTIPSAKDYGFE